MSRLNESRIVRLTINGEQWHFGSLKAIYELFTPEQIGITYSSLKSNYPGQSAISLKRCTIERLPLYRLKNNASPSAE